MTSPVSLIVTAFASVSDVRGTLTPQLNATEDTTLVLVDLGAGKNRMAGSILAQTLDQMGDNRSRPRRRTAPDRAGERGERIASQRPGAGLPRPWRRWFAGHCGRNGFRRPCRRGAERGHLGAGRRRCFRQPHGQWRGQELDHPGGRTPRRTDPQGLFNEELGAVLQVRTSERDAVLQTLREHGLGTMTHVIGKTRPASSTIDAGKGELQVWRDAKAVVQCQAGRPAPGVGRRELEDRPAARQPGLCRLRTRCGWPGN